MGSLGPRLQLAWGVLLSYAKDNLTTASRKSPWYPVPTAISYYCQDILNGPRVLFRCCYRFNYGNAILWERTNEPSVEKEINSDILHVTLMALDTWKQVFKGAFGFIIMADILRGNRCFPFSFFF